METKPIQMHPKVQGAEGYKLHPLPQICQKSKSFGEIFQREQ